MTADEILKSIDQARAPIASVEVPEWGATVYVKDVSCFEMERWESEQAKAAEQGRGTLYFRARAIVAFAADATGNLLFNETHVQALSRERATVLNRIYQAGKHVLGIVDSAKVEEAAKNSPETQGDASSTD